MTTPDTTTPPRATDDDWRCVEDNAKAGSRTHRCIRTIYDLLSLTREALADLEQRVGALEELTTTSLADVADAFERAGQRVAALHASAPEPDFNGVIGLAAIIREVDGNHDKGAATLAEAILRHPHIAKVLPGEAPAPAAAPSPAGSLVEVVAEALRLNEASYNVFRTYILRESDARAAIAAIAKELHRRGDHGVAAWMEREPGL